jgi:hypothetical protein
MLAIIHKNVIVNTKWIYVVLAAVWLNLMILTCANALAIGHHGYVCPCCPTSENGPCHSKVDCSNCDAGKNTLTSQEFNVKHEDNEKNIALTSWHEKNYALESSNSNIFILTTVENYILLPIYLKNCAFLY